MAHEIFVVACGLSSCDVWTQELQCRDLVPDEGWNPRFLHWRPGPLGKSEIPLCLNLWSLILIDERRTLGIKCGLDTY